MNLFRSNICSVLYAGLIMVLTVGAGCAPSRIDPLEPGTKFKLTIIDASELDGRYIVNPKGKITLPKIGEIKLKGLLPEEAEDRIRKKVEKEFSLDDPTVVITLISPAFL